MSDSTEIILHPRTPARRRFLGTAMAKPTKLKVMKGNSG
jgi:hypothetical protein